MPILNSLWRLITLLILKQLEPALPPLALAILIVLGQCCLLVELRVIEAVGVVLGKERAAGDIDRVQSNFIIEA